MLNPVGPMPASVYWRRRALAAAVLVVVLLLGWLLLSGGGGGDQRRNTAAAAGSPSPTQPEAAPAGTPTELSATPPGDDPGRAGDGDGNPVATTPPVTPAPTPRPTPAPPAPEPCADAALRLGVAPAQPQYAVGQTPVLNLQVRNVSTVACTRDLGAALQEILLYRGSTRLWSSNDCYPEGERDPQVLAPGTVRTFSVTWSGLSSKQDCAGTRTRVGAGSYTLVARLGTLISRRTPIVLR